MKKFSVIALALVAAMLFAIPAMAVDVEFSGHYRVRGYFTRNMAMDNTYDTSDAKFDNRFRMMPVFKISDRLAVHTQIDGLDNQTWGTAGQQGEDLGMERAWMAIKFDMFDLDIGRMKSGTCGLGYCDSQADDDQIAIKFKGLEPFALQLNYTKEAEGDYVGVNTNNQSADEDRDVYSVQGSWETEGLLVGAELAYTVDRTNTTYNTDYATFNPFVKGNFMDGALSFNAELQYKTGDYAEYDSGSTNTDRDYKAVRWMADVAWDFGPGSVGLGYAHSDGQSRTETDYTNAALGGGDWEPFLIMTHRTANGNLGGLGGNFNGAYASTGLGTGTWGDAGYDIFYLYGDYALMENVTLNAIIGMATADEVSNLVAAGAAQPEDDIGTEFNVGVKWQIMDNLTYDAKLGFLAVDDFWKLGSATSTRDEDVFSILHTLIVTF